MMFENAISACAFRPRGGVWRCLAFAAAFGFVSALFAAEMSSTDAARAAKAWVDRGYAMGAFASERTVAGVDAIEDATTGARLHVVRFEGGGFVVLSTDDLIDPVLAFSATGDSLATTDDNPLWALLRGDIAARETAAGVVRRASSTGGRKVASSSRGLLSAAPVTTAARTASQRKWSALLGGGMRLLSSAIAPQETLSDMRVSPLLQSKWGQDYDIDKNKCYNYFTPDEYPCGCVATAGAQVMRYFQWPPATTIIPPFTNSYCQIDGTNATLTTQGGSYDWSMMPFDPEDPFAHATDEHRRAIGRLTSDIGICCGMFYNSYEKGGSSVGLYMVAQTFRDYFNYRSALAAQWDLDVDKSQTDAFRRAIISNLDAGLPVMVSLVGVLEGFNHAAVVDGYGYSDGGLFVHMNFGWYGIADDVWYAPSNITTEDEDPRYNYSAIDGFVFNIFPNMPANTVICSGRILDADGNPVAGAVVSYCPAGDESTTPGGAASGGTVGRVLSNEKGIYALTLPPGTYKVRASYGGTATTGAASEAHRQVTLLPNVATKTAYPNQYWSDPSPEINNLIDQDLVLSSLASVAVPVFDPPSCLFYPTTNVAITCATSGATIRYTLDGTEPTETSLDYTGPIAISDDAVITAKAWADGMNPSAVLSETYTYDASQGVPKGDFFADPIIISGTSGSRVVVDNSAYTVEPEEPLHTPWEQYNTIWYEWTAPGSGPIEFHARFFNDQWTFFPMVAVYTGDSLSSIKKIAYDDDLDEDGVAILRFQATQGETYRVVGVSFYDDCSGTFSIEWSGNLVVEPPVVRYSVRFNANGGRGEMDDQIIAVGETQDLNQCRFERMGYAFAGWATSPTGTVRYGDGTGVKDLATSEDVVNLYACWDANRYTVSFDANGGEGEMAAQGGVYDTAFSLPANPFMWTGHTFMGWTAAAGGDAEFADGATVSNLTAEADGHVTLYAVWAVNRYTLSFDANGGSAVASITQGYGTAVSAPAAPVRTGYTFAGWTPSLPETMPAQDMRMVARWTANLYTVAFEANGGEGEMAAQDGMYGTAFSLPANPFTWTGHTFMGWTAAAGGDAEFADGATVSNLTAEANGRVTFYAVWAVNRYTLSFDANGGSAVAPITQDYGTAVTAPDAPARTRYTFVGWDPPLPATMPAQDMGFVAQWTADGPVVTFDANEGDVQERSRVVDKGKAIGDLPTPVRTGYAFDGWFTAASGGTKVTATTKVSADVTYHAHWRYVGSADETHIYINVENAYSSEGNGEFLLGLSDLVESYTVPKIAVKGLPAGLKFDAKTLAISGKATKPGVYMVKISVTNATVKKAVEKEFRLTVPNLVWPEEVGVRLDDKYTLQAGMVPDALATVTANGWNLAVSGLPSGLKYDAKKGTMTGIATKAGVYTVTFTATKDKRKEIATATFEVEFPTLTLDVMAYMDESATNKVKVTGGGKYAFGTKVSFKATPDKGNVFAGWFDVDGRPLAGGADYRTASCAYLATDSDVTLTALFAKESEDIASLKVTVTNATTAADGTFELDLGSCVASLSIPKLTVKGVPTGLKFDSKTLKITGKATKPGVYTVTVEATNTSVKKATDDSKGAFTLTVPNKTCAALPELKSATDAYATVVCGVAFDPARMDIDCTPAAADWTVKVAGLPAGLKYDAKTGKITGVSTAKPGSYTVTFTATRGKEKQEATITLNVDALPNWAVGTFNGVTDDGAPVTLTVAANGKISVKTTLADGKSLSLAAASFDTVVDGGFHAAVIGKNGKEVVTNEVMLTSVAVDGVDAGVALADVWSVWQNLWKRTDTKGDMPVFKTNIDMTVELGEKDDSDNTVKLTFKKDGVVSFAGKVGGTKVSGSSQLVNDGTGWSVTLYAPPKTTAKPPFARWSKTFVVTLTTDEKYIVKSVVAEPSPED